jgi:hypothetical protein
MSKILLRHILIKKKFWHFCWHPIFRFGALKSDSTHHFFRNACTKSGSLRFSQFSGCWLILSVYILITVVKSSTKFSEVNVKDTFTSHIDKKKILTFLLTPYLYTFSLYENPSFIFFSAETEYISTRSWYRNIISHTGILMTFYLSIILDLQNVFHWYILKGWKLKRPQIQLRRIIFGLFTLWKSITYYRLCRDRIFFDKVLVSEYKLIKRSNKANILIALVQ